MHHLPSLNGPAMECMQQTQHATMPHTNILQQVQAPLLCVTMSVANIIPFTHVFCFISVLNFDSGEYLKGKIISLLYTEIIKSNVFELGGSTLGPVQWARKQWTFILQVDAFRP